MQSIPLHPLNVMGCGWPYAGPSHATSSGPVTPKAAKGGQTTTVIYWAEFNQIHRVLQISATAT